MNTTIQRYTPDGLHAHPAFTHVATVSGDATTIYVGGQNAVTADGEVVGAGDLAAQTTKALANLETALASAGARLDDVLKWTVHVVDGQPVDEGFAAFAHVWGGRGDPPLITMLRVAGLAHPEFLVEIDTVAAIPADRTQAHATPAKPKR